MANTAKALPRVLVTGSSGAVGKALISRLADHVTVIGLDLVSNPSDMSGVLYRSESVTNPVILRELMRGTKAVVHLATGSPRGWSGLLEVDILGTRTAYRIAVEQGVNRFIFASTNHVFGGFEVDRLADPRGESITGADAHAFSIRPDSEYGAVKAFGEAYGRYVAETTPVAVSCIRIGTVRVIDDPEHYADDQDFEYIPGGHQGRLARLRATWLYHEDLNRIMLEEIEAEDKFRLRYGVSDNPGRFWPLEVLAWNPDRRLEPLTWSLPKGTTPL